MPRFHPCFSSIPSLLWQKFEQLTVHPDRVVSESLFDTGSLSKRLARLSDGFFAVTRLREEKGPLHDDECVALNVPLGSSGWVREVYLTGYGKPWVYARSVVPESVLQQGELEIASLGDTPLGKVLFGSDHFQRGALEICRYLESDQPSRTFAEPLWMRRSNFVRGAMSVLVSEMFLPGFWEVARERLF